ncbi:MAG TPA: hypothetical protein DCR46_09335 [Cytophagales bacterium]|nr:hypothetical protein [Cytophagales bacterium]
MKNAYLKILIYTIVLAIATKIAATIFLLAISTIAWASLAFYSLLTMGIHAIVSPSLQSKKQQFIVVFMGTLGIRMFFSIAFLLLYLFFSSKIEISFILYYLLGYLFFVGFEIYLLLSNLRPDLKKGINKE